MTKSWPVPLLLVYDQPVCHIRMSEPAVKFEICNDMKQRDLHMLKTRYYPPARLTVALTDIYFRQHMI